jgi:hypothetical protein
MPYSPENTSGIEQSSPGRNNFLKPIIIGFLAVLGILLVLILGILGYFLKTYGVSMDSINKAVAYITKGETVSPGTTFAAKHYTPNPAVESYLQQAMQFAKDDCQDATGSAAATSYDQDLVDALKPYTGTENGLRGQFIHGTKCKIESSDTYAIYVNKLGKMVLLQKVNNGIVKKEL